MFLICVFISVYKLCFCQYICLSYVNFFHIFNWLVSILSKFCLLYFFYIFIYLVSILPKFFVYLEPIFPIFLSVSCLFCLFFYLSRVYFSIFLSVLCLFCVYICLSECLCRVSACLYPGSLRLMADTEVDKYIQTTQCLPLYVHTYIYIKKVWYVCKYRLYNVFIKKCNIRW